MQLSSCYIIPGHFLFDYNMKYFPFGTFHFPDILNFGSSLPKSTLLPHPRLHLDPPFLVAPVPFRITCVLFFELLKVSFATFMNPFLVSWPLPTLTHTYVYVCKIWKVELKYENMRSIIF